jgi:chromosome partitioning protein
MYRNGGAGVATIFAVCSHKGGTGKTTFCFTLAGWLQKKGYKTLVLDLDSQANLTAWLGHTRAKYGGHIADAIDVLHGDWRPQMFMDHICEIKIPGVRTPLYLVPGTRHFNLTTQTMDARRSEDPEIGFRLNQALDLVRPWFDYIIIDTAPAVDDFSVALTLRSADVVCLPLDGAHAAQGSVDLLYKIRSLHEERTAQGREPLKGFFVNPHFIDDFKAAPYGPEEVREDSWYPLLHQTFPDHFLTPVVRHSTSYVKAQKAGKIQAALTEAGRRDYRYLIDTLLTAVRSGGVTPMSKLLAEGDYDLGGLRRDLTEIVKQTEVTIRPVYLSPFSKTRNKTNG